MTFPPSTLRLRFRHEGRRFGLWLPLILIWPFFIALALVLAPLVLVTSALLWPIGWGRSLLLAGPVMFRIFCSPRGLEVEVRDGHQLVQVRFQ